MVRALWSAERDPRGQIFCPLTEDQMCGQEKKDGNGLTRGDKEEAIPWWMNGWMEDCTGLLDSP